VEESTIRDDRRIDKLYNRLQEIEKSSTSQQSTVPKPPPDTILEETVLTQSATITNLSVKLEQLNTALTKIEKNKGALKKSNRDLRGRLSKLEQFVSKRIRSDKKRKHTQRSTNSNSKKKKLAVSSSPSPIPRTGNPPDPNTHEEPLQLLASPNRKQIYSSSGSSTSSSASDSDEEGSTEHNSD
jgi:uncharacterized coiled-coil protein SlyX